jgi:hypothetical protein
MIDEDSAICEACKHAIDMSSVVYITRIENYSELTQEWYHPECYQSRAERRSSVPELPQELKKLLR